jgi:hypothetical protein
MLAPVEAPCHFAKLAVKVFRRKPVVSADDLALENSPNAFDAICVDIESTDIFPCRMINGAVNVILVQALKRAMFIR